MKNKVLFCIISVIFILFSISMISNFYLRKKDDLKPNFTYEGTKTSHVEKKLLKLGHDDMRVYEDLEAENKKKNISNMYLKIEEKNNGFYSDKDYNYYSEIINYIKKELKIEINSNWEISVTILGENDGLLKFIYYITPEIITNRSIIFYINNNQVTQVQYSYLENNIEDNKIKEKVRDFKSTTEQEKIKLNNNEKLDKETTEFIYNFKLNKLFYKYKVIINNNNRNVDYYSIYEIK